jgi:hypothetical protein
LDVHRRKGVHMDPCDNGYGIDFNRRPPH